MAEKSTDKKAQDQDQEQEQERGDRKPGHNWADEAAKARTSDDPRARTPRDSVGQPSTRSFEE